MRSTSWYILDLKTHWKTRRQQLKWDCYSYGSTRKTWRDLEYRTSELRVKGIWSRFGTEYVSVMNVTPMKRYWVRVVHVPWRRTIIKNFFYYARHVSQFYFWKIIVKIFSVHPISTKVSIYPNPVNSPAHLILIHLRRFEISCEFEIIFVSIIFVWSSSSVVPITYFFSICWLSHKRKSISSVWSQQRVLAISFDIKGQLLLFLYHADRWVHYLQTFL